MLHTPNFPNGEIRGQVRLVAAAGASDHDHQYEVGDYDDD
jgi:hypothetical protein